MAPLVWSSVLRLGQEDEAEGQQQAQAVLSAFAPDVLVLLAGEATAFMSGQTRQENG